MASRIPNKFIQAVENLKSYHNKFKDIYKWDVNEQLTAEHIQYFADICVESSRWFIYKDRKFINRLIRYIKKLIDTGIRGETVYIIYRCKKFTISKDFRYTDCVIPVVINERGVYEFMPAEIFLQCHIKIKELLKHLDPVELPLLINCTDDPEFMDEIKKYFIVSKTNLIF